MALPLLSTPASESEFESESGSRSSSSVQVQLPLPNVLLQPDLAENLQQEIAARIAKPPRERRNPKDEICPPSVHFQPASAEGERRYPEDRSCTPSVLPQLYSVESLQQEIPAFGKPVTDWRHPKDEIYATSAPRAVPGAPRQPDMRQSPAGAPQHPHPDMQHLLPASERPHRAREQLPNGAAVPVQARGPSGFGHLQQLLQETGTPIELLQELDTQGLLHQIPRNDQGDLSSVGSINHRSGQCLPCIFWFNSSCMKGLSCDYCHFRHKGQKFKRIRPSKKTRDYRRNDEGRGGQEIDDDNDSAPNVEYPRSLAGDMEILSL